MPLEFLQASFQVGLVSAEINIISGLMRIVK